MSAGCPHCGSSTKHKRWCSDQQIIDAYKDLRDAEEDKTCEQYETLGDGIECIHYDEEVYSAGTSRYCRFFGEDVYYLKTKNCFHRGIYSDDVHSPGGSADK